MISPSLRASIPALLLALCHPAFALGELQVGNAAPGQRTLILTVDDSIRAPDLSKIHVEGYEIENAVFVEEGDDSLRFAPGFVDLTAPGNGRVLDFDPDRGVMVLDAPLEYVPQVGAILADTAFGGILRKVVSLEGSPQSVPFGLRWTLRTSEAALAEAILDADIAFRTRVDLNTALPDRKNAGEVAGTLDDGSPAFGEMAYALSRARIHFQPWVSGRILISRGKVSVLKFNIQGDCEVAASLRGGLTGTGEFEFEEDLGGRAPIMIPLGNGLFVKVAARSSVRIEAKSEAEGFSASADFRVVNSLRGELGFNAGQWRPLADNRATFENKALQELWGSGEMTLMLKSRVEVLVQGVQGPAFTFQPYARLASADSRQLRSFTAPNGRAAAFGAGNKALSLGSNVFMETRINFTGPPLVRSFLLFNHEQTLMAPPREGRLSVLLDSGKAVLSCETYPKADWYIIQQKLGNGPWETLVENAPGPKVRLSGLKPSTQYRFRAIGVNAMGTGPAFPPEGIVHVTPAANHPPFVPLARFPDSGAAVGDSALTLAWRGGDPDAGAKVLYTILIDTQNPPALVRAAAAETSLAVGPLNPGTYYWRVVASDGLERSEGPVRSFTVRAAEVPVAAKPAAGPVSPPMAFIPKGTFRREDGRIVNVGPFLLGRYEVTQGEFERVMGRNPSYRLQDALPVERVTWEEAETFCRETGGRLPTEAEWEYAARAGGPTAYWGKADAGEYAWFRDNSENRTQRVGLKKPNAWGLHDMAGNVFEWAQDWYGEYAPGEVENPRGPATGVAKVIRGASWYSEAGSLNLSARYNNRPGFRNFKVGFRCAKDADDQETAVSRPSTLAAGTRPAAAIGTPEGAAAPRTQAGPARIAADQSEPAP